MRPKPAERNANHAADNSQHDIKDYSFAGFVYQLAVRSICGGVFPLCHEATNVHVEHNGRA